MAELSSVAENTQALELINQDYQTLATISDRLISTFDPRDHLYVGLGSSPTGLAAYFRVHHPQFSFLTIPMKGLSPGGVFKGLLKVSYLSTLYSVVKVCELQSNKHRFY